MKIVFEEEENQLAIEFLFSTEPCKPGDYIQMHIGERVYWIKAGDVQRLAAAITAIPERSNAAFPFLLPRTP